MKRSKKLKHNSSENKDSHRHGEVNDSGLASILENGLSYHKSGNLTMAGEFYRQILSRDPNNVNALHLLGYLSHQNGDNLLAEKYLRQVINLHPHDPKSYYVLGNALYALGKREGAISCYEKALHLKPDYIEALNNIGVICRERGDVRTAEKHFLMALQLDPCYADAHHNMGLVLLSRGENEAAIGHSREALRLNPDHIEAMQNLAKAYVNMGEIDRAIVLYQKIIGLAPDHSFAHSNLLFTMNYHPSLSPEQIFTEHCRWGEMHTPSRDKLLATRSNVQKTHHTPLRIGYVSPDFRQHPLAFFIGDVLAKHNRGIFEITCYSNVANPDSVTDNLQNLPDRWRKIHGLDDIEVCKLVRQDKIDILVDLAGHTADNRLTLFALKPAPVQITYLGHPSTTGLKSIDYRITDSWCDPPGMTERYNSEELVRLPHAFFCFHPPEGAPEVNELPAMEKGNITFGSFNNIAKISDNVLKLWAAILTSIPDSNLLMQAGGLSNTSTRQRIYDYFKSHGVSKDRIKMFGHTSFHEHLAIHHQVDIALDSFPWNGHTTTCNTLFMGVPVLTIAGILCAGRMGVSILSNLDLQELIAESPNEYVKKAVTLAGDLSKLQKLRSGLREKILNSHLTDTNSFIKSLEEAYLSIWDRQCAK